MAGVVETISEPGLTRPGLGGAAGDAKDATDLFIDELTGLGAPDTQAGADAEDTVNELAADLQTGADDLEAAVSSASTTAGAVTSVTNALTTMGNQITSTFTQLGQLDAQGEIEDGFQQSSPCKPLTG